ncbi:ABC transporter substrate-binding protein [Melittangium boletus]|uniref:Branched-chain amino acid ABC transporter substrate-binding protein n=1 Tax=Melittangium boletus DSM 14713 TaxID=1294270 RepID=A0A250I688_9BACT|nr:ABC transporter substrate-binding protein [Melittangium boletus]ATB26693.1 branched-chain amino acid ABC transporter substrate-binding protein [Melittangium boletus DSM 14713]
MRRWSPVLLAVLASCMAACEKKTPPVASPERALDVENTPPEVREVLLGEVGSLTGAQAAFGISSRNGFDMALQEINAAGGVKGKKLVVRVYDSQGRPEDAAQAATRLITRDKVVLILGEVSSSNSMAMAEKAQAAGVPMISHAATHPAVTQKGDYIFRICFIDPFQGFVMAKFAREDLKLERVAILQDNKSDYSLGLGEVFTRDFTRLGGRIVATESYSQGDTDFRAQLTAIKQTRPQAVYIPGYYSDVGIIARQARELGLTVPLLGSDGWDAETLFELAGTALEGSYFTSPYALDSPDARMREFVAAYRKLYGIMPDTSSVLAYEAAKVAAAALERAPDWSGPSLRDAIAKTRNFPGVAGPISLDANRDAVKPAVVLKVHDGKAGFVTTIQP